MAPKPDLDPPAKRAKPTPNANPEKTKELGTGSSGHALGGPRREEENPKKIEFGTYGQMPTFPALGSEPPTWEAYYKEMVEWVRNVIPIGLKELGVHLLDVGLALPTKIEENTSETGRNALTTFRGDWDVGACVQSMESTTMYENNGSAHWLDVKSGKVMFAGEVLLEEHTPWNQVAAAFHCWSWDRYLNSSEKPAMRRLMFPVTVPSALHSTLDAKKSIKVEKKLKDGRKVTEERPTFKDCPVLAGRAHILAMYHVMGKCLTKWTEQDQLHFLKLWEACYQNFDRVTPFTDPPVPGTGATFPGG